ncbi:hypothetical protein BJV78DRAFT_1157358 [Lactifluus subvellereus]|nr:hypothetical protein BJV78DRAFT_1157358 [Lactifluus subvellereus]
MVYDPQLATARERVFLCISQQTPNIKAGSGTIFDYFDALTNMCHEQFLSHGFEGGDAESAYRVKTVPVMKLRKRHVFVTANKDRHLDRPWNVCMRIGEVSYRLSAVGETNLVTIQNPSARARGIGAVMSDYEDIWWCVERSDHHHRDNGPCYTDTHSTLASLRFRVQRRVPVECFNLITESCPRFRVKLRNDIVQEIPPRKLIARLPDSNEDETGIRDWSGTVKSKNKVRRIEDETDKRRKGSKGHVPKKKGLEDRSSKDANESGSA